MRKLTKYKDILFSTLAEITSLIIAGNDKKIIVQRLLDCSLIVLEAEHVYLLEMSGDRIIKYSKAKKCMQEGEMSIEITPEKSGVREWMIREGIEGKGGTRIQKGEELAFNVPFLADHYLDESDKARIIISAPLMAKKSMFGLLIAIHRPDGGLYANEDVKLITILANQAAIAVENALLYQKLEKEAITDGLTGVYNYRFMISSMETEIKRARRFKQEFSFVMLDVDNLKDYNDKLGHLSGSQALKEIACIIQESCREIDLVCKYGGDEFGILLPQTSLQGAEKVTRRIIRAVSSHKFDGMKTGLLTCSAGISSFPRDGDSVKELIGNADKALYQAKRSGKNKLSTTLALVIDVSD
jgi:diguanylate cyclase (GGDEF)-like protein